MSILRSWKSSDVSIVKDVVPIETIPKTFVRDNVLDMLMLDG